MGYVKKADYIALYGEDAWNAYAEEKYRKQSRQYAKEHKEERKEYGKQYCKEHAEERKEYKKRYRQEHKESCKEYDRQYRQEHKEERAAYNRQWRKDNPEKNKQYYQDNIEERKEYSRQYYQEHKEEYKQYREDNKDSIAEQMKQYRSTQFGRAVNLKNRYIQTDKEKGFPTDQNIDEDWIIENIFGSSCIYCGESDWTKLGCDRIDNTKGHTPNNCVCSCWDCNNKRNDKFTVEEFIQYRKLHPREEQVP